MVGEVVVDLSGLVSRLREVIRESTSASNPGDFRGNCLCATDGKNVRTSSGKRGSELSGVFAVIRQTRCANTSVTGRLKDGDATKPHHGDHVANSYRVLIRNSIFIVSVGVGDDLRKLRVGKTEKILVVPILG